MNTIPANTDAVIRKFFALGKYFSLSLILFSSKSTNLYLAIHILIPTFVDNS